MDDVKIGYELESLEPEAPDGASADDPADEAIARELREAILRKLEPRD